MKIKHKNNLKEEEEKRSHRKHRKRSTKHLYVKSVNYDSVCRGAELELESTPSSTEAGSSKLGSLASCTSTAGNPIISALRSPDQVNLPPWPPFFGDPSIPVPDFRSLGLGLGLPSAADFVWAFGPLPVGFMVPLHLTGFLVSISLSTSTLRFLCRDTNREREGIEK
ncbi:hypothetical protein Dimus_034586 [Dionaea muscipula]